MVATPWPPPTHMVASACLPPVRASSDGRLARDPRPAGPQRMPERNGAAIQVHPRMVQHQVPLHRQRLRGEGLVQLDHIHRAVICRFGPRQRLARRPAPARCPSRRAHSRPPRSLAIAGQHRQARASRHTRRCTTSTADAPSVRGELVPAVTVPVARNAGFSARQRLACEVSARMQPSWSTTPDLVVDRQRSRRRSRPSARRRRRRAAGW